MLGRHHDAQARRQPRSAQIGRRQRLRQFAQDPLRDPFDVLDRAAIGHQQRELVAADPGHGVLRPHDIL